MIFSLPYNTGSCAPVQAEARRDKVRDESVLLKYRTERCLEAMAIEAYCVKCKAKKIMQDPVEGTTKNGKPITKGKCPDCGTTICRIGAAK